MLESTILFVIIGMNGAMETLVSQAYGAGQFTLCGIYLNRARLINTVMFVPLVLLLLFTKQFLLHIG